MAKCPVGDGAGKQWGQWGHPLPAGWKFPAERGMVWPWRAFLARRSFCAHEDLEGPTLEYDRNDGTGEHYIKMISNIPGSDIWLGWVSELGRFDVINMKRPPMILSARYNGKTERDDG